MRSGWAGLRAPTRVWVFLLEELLLPGGLWKDVVRVYLCKMQQTRAFCIAVFHKFPKLYHILFDLILLFKAPSAWLQLCCWLSAPFVLRTQFFGHLLLTCAYSQTRPSKIIMPGSPSSWKTQPYCQSHLSQCRFHSPTFLPSLVFLHLTFWKPIY